MKVKLTMVRILALVIALILLFTCSLAAFAAAPTNDEPAVMFLLHDRPKLIWLAAAVGLIAIIMPLSPIIRAVLCAPFLLLLIKTLRNRRSSYSSRN